MKGITTIHSADLPVPEPPLMKEQMCYSSLKDSRENEIDDDFKDNSDRK